MKVVAMLRKANAKTAVFQAVTSQVANQVVAVGALLSPIPTIYHGVIKAPKPLCQPQVLRPHQATNAATCLSELIVVSLASTREVVRTADVVGFQWIQILPISLGASTKEARPPRHHRPQYHHLRQLHLPRLLLRRCLPRHLHHHHLDLCRVAMYST